MTNKQHNQHLTSEKGFRFGIRKFKFGTASVAIASTLFMMATPVAQAQENEALSVEVVSDDQPSDQPILDTTDLAPQATPSTPATDIQPEPVAQPILGETRSAVALEFNDSGELNITDEATSPVAELAPQPAADPAPVEQIAPVVENINRDIYAFTKTPLDVPVATVASTTPVTVNVQQVAGSLAGTAMDLPGLEATADGRLVGQLESPGLNRRQLTYTNQAGTSKTETITVHAVDVQVLRWVRFYNAPITDENVLRNIIVNPGNDTTFSPDQIIKRVVTPLSDFPAKTGRIDVEITLPNGVSKVFDVTPMINRKPLVEAIETAARDKRLALTSSRELTREEKTEVRALIERERAAAVANVEAAALADLVAIQTKSLDTLAAISLDSPIKADARQNLDRLVEAKKVELERRTDLTSTSKQDAQTLLGREADKLRDAIYKSQTNAEVTLSKRKASQVIAAITPVADLVSTPKKHAATTTATSATTVTTTSSNNQTLVNTINDEARKKRLALTSSRDLTTEEKNTARLAIERARQAALANPTSAKELEALKAVSLESPVKTDARQNLDRLVEAKKAELERRTDLTVAAKQAAQTQLKREADKLRDAIDKSRTNAEVALSKRKSSEVITGINPAADVVSNLTTTPKNQIVATTTTATVTTVAAPTTATTPNTTTATSSTTAATSNTSTSSVDTINDEARKKRLALTASRDLTVEEKNTARQAIERARQAALAKPNSVQELEALKAVSLESAVKTDARQALKRLVEEKAAELNRRSDLTTAAKQAAQTQLKREADKLRDAIDKSRTNAEVALSKRKMIDVITAITPN